MSFITDMIMQQVGDGAAGKIAEQLGVSESVAKTAISAGLPMLMGALGRNASDPSGAEALSGALQKDHDGSILNDLMGALGDSGQLDAGSAILKHVLGNKQGNAQQAIGQAAGMDAGQAGDLLSMLAPIVLGQLGKTQQEQGLDASGLADILQGERKNADEQLGGMMGLLDMDGDGEVTDDVMSIGKRLLSRFFS
ncbi:MAG: DUF937 domain-containing protein [Chloroflexota bacterium]